MKINIGSLIGMVLLWSCTCCDGGNFLTYSGGRQRNYISSGSGTSYVTLDFQGTVTDAKNGSPIKGAKIVLYHLPDIFTRQDLKSVKTNKNGRYSLNFSGEVKWKFVYLTVSKSGYASQEKWIQHVYFGEFKDMDFKLIKSETS